MKDGGRWKILLESLRFLQNLCAWAVDFNYFTNLGYVNKLVYQPLAINFSQNAPLVVVPEIQIKNILGICMIFYEGSG